MSEALLRRPAAWGDAPAQAVQEDAEGAGLQIVGPRRHLALPLVREGRQFGVLFLDSDMDELPGLEDPVAMDAFMDHLEAAVECATRPQPELRHEGGSAAEPQGDPSTLRIRRFPRNDVIFVDGEYLIKGLAGVIFWRLLRDYERLGRTEFSNLELRLELAQTHPERADNLESRMVTLIRRLENRPDLRIERAGRGKFRLVVTRPIELADA